MELRILSGLHRGAVMEIDGTGNGVVIGSSPGGDFDVLLADSGIARRHCQLLLKGGHWQLDPLEGKVFDAQGDEVTGATDLERGQTFRLDTVWIGFFLEDDAWVDPSAAAATTAKASANAGYPRLKTPALALVAVCVLAIPTAWFASTAWGNVKRTGDPEVLAPEKVAAAVVAETPLSPAKLADEFTRALIERDLRDRLELQLSPEQWEIRGSLDADERQRFERLLMRFADARKPTFPIRVSLVTPAELLPFKVVEVITGKGASIVTDAGERLHVGEAYQGWKLVSVESGKVAFQGRQRVEVPL